MAAEGFYITELRLTGRNKINASVIFRKGLNVISGASDTGKSYIFQCINYVFGSSDEPKEIDESMGYSTIYLEIESYLGETKTLKRDIGEPKIQVYDCKIDEITPLQDFIDLKGSHDPKDDNNISTFLLSFNNIESMKLRKNQRGEKVAFSFRNFVRMIMINEEKIISEISPILSGIPTNKTAELSAFKAVLTGVDDSGGPELEDPKIYKTRLEAKLEIINNLIQKLRKEIEEKKELVIDLDSNNLDLQIEQVSERIADNSKIINENMEERKRIWEEEQEIKSRILMLEELVGRFDLLKKSYLSDLDRLQFIIEGDHFISQLYDSNCPICNNTINQEAFNFLEHNHAIQVENLQIACEEESDKLRSQLLDLNDTVSTLKSELEEKRASARELNQKIAQIDQFIQKELKPISVIAMEHLKFLLNTKKLFHEIEINEKRILEYQITQRDIMHELSKKNVKIQYVNEISEEIYKDFSNEIKTLLENWNYPDLTSVSFDHETHDLVVSGKKRKNHGKGYRAILNAAFTIGLMKYTRKLGLKHPGMVILDSPLTTYKEKAEKTFFWKKAMTFLWT
ncbi:hypothetical protein EXW96_25715 [Paenibacillus sp. JMULE4]|uniref:hypothetical protein n=1 Tax=Paenibacillus sp. JMULE4 TaxID=2518342 RepID=UPI001576226D|nr:hypothetical protein [Paenibacillus sp. JMULE4]NTZ20790.1 hypothetical protein [Paenibacillus sp. JMULE4]